jgi:membrane protease YdiL (CAAX protease family)
VTSAWTLLVLGAALSLGPFPTYAGACALAFALRAPGRPPLSPAALALGAGAGFASYPAWIGMVVLAGIGLDLAPRLLEPPLPFEAAPFVTFVLLGPVFEELLYREKLLAALETRLGRVPAVVTSAAAFALPHLEPWSVLTTFLLGLALAALYLRAGNVAPCIGVHMGLNLAALACGVPPTRWALLPWEAAIAGVLLAALAVRSSRAGPAAPRPC